MLSAMRRVTVNMEIVFVNLVTTTNMTAQYLAVSYDLSKIYFPSYHITF